MIIGPSYLPVPVSALKIIGLGHDQCVNDRCVNDQHVQVTQLTEGAPPPLLVLTAYIHDNNKGIINMIILLCL
jgi:hypothetical protein